jgi:uncharacterized YceG family protein
MIPPQPRWPERRRPPRGVVLRRRLLALGLFAAAIVAAGFAIASVGGDDKSKPATTATVAPTFKIIFPEGFTRREMAERISAVDKIAEDERGVRPRLTAQAYLRATRRVRPRAGFGRVRPAEGFLFPATFEFAKDTTSAQLAAEQLDAFRKNWAKVDLRYTRSKNLTPYDVLIIASMVEKEAAAPEERGKIARVIYNRLHHGMVLGIDATIRYGLGVPATQSLRESQLNMIHPYNTRRVAGLTPTPIANPGLASIQAAAHPEPGDWLFFVRKPDKLHHFFTASEREFENYKKAHGYK